MIDLYEFDDDGAPEDIQLDCPADCKAQVLQLCRCVGFYGPREIDERHYIYGELHRVLDYWAKPHDPDLRLSACNRQVTPKVLFYLLNKLYGPVTLGWERLNNGGAWEGNDEMVFDPLTMQVTSAVSDGADMVRQFGVEPIQGYLEDAAKEKGIVARWTMEHGSLLPAREDDPEAGYDADVFRRFVIDIATHWADYSETEPITPEGLEASLVTDLLEESVRQGCGELTALLLEKFRPVAEDEFGQPVYDFTPGG